MSNTETWRDVVGYEGVYSVSDLGRVKSLERAVVYATGAVHTLKERILQASLTQGYLKVSLSRGGKAKTQRVHTLVLRAFRGDCPDGMEGCHNNGVRNDSRLENLRYDTRENNQNDKYLHGTDRRGTKHPMVKLTEVQVREIRRLYAAGGVTYKELGEVYGVHFVCVGAIIRRVTWAHL